MKSTSFILISMLLVFNYAVAQKSKASQVFVDIGHGQKFWNDPNNMVSEAGNDLNRVKYLTGELEKTATAFDAQINYLRDEIGSDMLTKCDLLMIHVPTAIYTKNEVNTIVDYVESGGSLLMIMEVDYWTTLEKTNVNDIIGHFDILYGQDSPDTLIGGYTKKGVITPEPLKITYQYGRTVTGGNPFCFNTQTEEYPFGVYKKLENGGKVIVMGDAMTSLYMTSWKGGKDYQCQAFMQDIFKWLLE